VDRDAIVAKLNELVSPLGPATSVAERREAQAYWADAGGVMLFDALVDLLASGRVAAASGPAVADDVEVLIVEVLARIGTTAPAHARDKACGLLDVEWARGVAIDVLGAVGGPPAVASLMALHHRERLDLSTRLRLVSALGEIGGGPALAALTALADTTDPGDRVLMREIALARELARRPA